MEDKKRRKKNNTKKNYEKILEADKKKFLEGAGDNKNKEEKISKLFIYTYKYFMKSQVVTKLDVLLFDHLYCYFFDIFMMLFLYLGKI